MSTIYIRAEIEPGKPESVSMTDAPWDQVETWLHNQATLHGPDFLVRVIKALYEDLRYVGEHLGVTRDDPG